MKNVSNEFKQIIKDGGAFYAYAEVTLSDGTSLTMDADKDFLMDGENRYSESGGEGFPLGVAMSKSINIGIDNSDERYSKYDFYYAQITLYTEADLSYGTQERIKEGTFTVIEPVAVGDEIEIVAYDNMYKSDVIYVPSVSLPNSALVVLQDVCSKCGINLGSATFKNSDFQIQEIPTGLTCRQMIGYISMIACGNAVMDANNRLIIKSYDFSVFEQIELITGGNLNQSIKDYVSGGTFGDGLTDTISGGTFKELSNFHILTDYSENPDISTDNVVITGIRMEAEGEEEDKTLVVGTEDYALTVSNELVKGKEEEFLELLGNAFIGVIARPFSGSFFPNPTVEFMDCLYLIDTKDNIYQSFVCNNEFKYLDSSNISNDLESPLRNNSDYYSNATEVYRKARAEAKRQKTEWEKAMEELTNRVNNSSGLYMTKEEQPDGSFIYYMHDKETLAESTIVWKMTAEAFAVSSDGGKTYTAGLTVDGTLIAKIMNTIGINFDWGIGGSLIIRKEDGTEVVYMDADTGEVRMNLENIIINTTGTKHFYSSDYDQDDVTVVRGILDGIIECTPVELEKYDIDGNGSITALDYVRVSNLANKTVSEYTLDLTLSINGINQAGLIQTSGVFIGKNGIWSKNLDCDYIISKQVGKVLWSGELWPNENQSIQLSDDLSNQFSGIVLHWQAYVDGALQDYDHVYTFISKTHALYNPGRGISIFLASGDLTYSATKYIFVSERNINGSATNARGEYVSGSGIKSTPNHWALTQVIGV